MYALYVMALKCCSHGAVTRRHVRPDLHVGLFQTDEPGIVKELERDWDCGSVT